MSDKETLRADMLRSRDALSDVFVQQSGDAITRRFCEQFLPAGDTFLLYWSIRNEVPTRNIIQALWQAGKTVLLPKLVDGVFQAGIVTPDTTLTSGAFFIPEPPRVSHMERIDIIAVPGVAFDTKGHRLGFGKGFYDRFLSTVTGTTVGLAYRFQVLDSVPHEAHDIPVDCVLTESAYFWRLA